MVEGVLDKCCELLNRAASKHMWVLRNQVHTPWIYS
jgi:hypothetical protein